MARLKTTAMTPADELQNFLRGHGPSTMHPNNPMGEGVTPSANLSNPAMNQHLPGAFNNPSNPQMNPDLPGSLTNPSNLEFNPQVPNSITNPSSPQRNPAYPTAINNPSSPNLNPAYPGAYTNPSNPINNPAYPTPSDVPRPEGISPDASVPPGRIGSWVSGAYYHVAPQEVRRSIEQYGIDRERGQSGTSYGLGFLEAQKPANYAWKTLEQAQADIEGRPQKWNIWEINHPGLDEPEIDPMSEGVYWERNIPAHMVRRVAWVSGKHPDFDPYYDEMAAGWRQLPYLYHTAPTALRDIIERDGLKVQNPGAPQEPGVYVEGNPDMVKDYWGDRKDITDRDVWQIDQRHIKSLMPDYMGQAAYIPHDLPPEALTLHTAAINQMTPNPNVWRYADNWTSDSRQWPDPSEPRAGKPPKDSGCTCGEGHKLDCPIHGMWADPDQDDHLWNLPEGSPVGYPQDAPRSWQQAYSGAPPNPPNYRKATKPNERCGTCKMFNKGLCWGFGNKKVESSAVCDEFFPENKSAAILASVISEDRWT